ncbi:MAG: redoxin domain-containing protein [Bacteroidales bacterium]|nr:redoxin domain-containing protein [Bacteroidales bacterium]
MNRKSTLTFLIVILSCSISSFGQVLERGDSLSVVLDKYISTYISTIPLNPDSLIQASDKLILSGSKNELSSYIAGRLFTMFRDTNIMGLEVVAIHIAENYFINGKFLPPPGLKQTDIQLFVEFNKHSLIGLEAPDLVMSDLQGDSISLLNNLGYKYTLLLFFNDECRICKTEIPQIYKLSDSLEADGLKVFSVYTNPDSSKALPSVKKMIGIIPTNWIIATDPSYSSDFQRLYNVIKTPQIFLLDKNGIIVGRNLDPKSIKELIKKLNEKEQELKNQATRFAAAYMEAVDYDDSLSVKESFQVLFNRLTVHNEKDLYRSIFSFIYEELLYSEEKNRNEASLIVAKNFIIPFVTYWEDPGYPLNWVISMVKRTESNRVGAEFPSFPLINTRGKIVKKIESCSRYTLIYFTDPNCPACNIFTDLLKSQYKSLRKKGLKVVAIYPMGTPERSKSYKNSKELKWDLLSPANYGSDSIFTIYEAERVPSSILIDRKRKIIAKNIDFATLNSIIK